ncbi:hypothetical protein H4O18_20690 [Arenibacter sp. BSSL-BM3]|uniref:Uncharacterized protein n=1 Tax=Arenibacter arenosicollis TaxID=2762274 RepID=A0ABR7QTB3_9FLAO|nr:hypothetical protein [Arenibacter arenosicollis]MBC8770425.1 hypothetical protein [Arenibacter arenosicollis]
MNKVIVIISFLLATSQLWSQNGIDLRSDKSLTKVFTDTEIKGLESMIQYVDDLVLDNGNRTGANETYHLFFEKIAKTPEYIVPFEENVKYQFLKSLDTAQFAAVWTFNDHIDLITYRDSIYRNLDNITTLELKPFSKYMDYLEEIGKEDPYFKSLRKLMSDVGNLSAYSAYWFTENHSKFDFNIPKNRLWAAIYLLTREETYEMKLDRYFKNQ